MDTSIYEWVGARRFVGLSVTSMGRRTGRRPDWLVDECRDEGRSIGVPKRQGVVLWGWVVNRVDGLAAP